MAEPRVLTLAIVDDDADVRAAARIVLRSAGSAEKRRLRFVELAHPAELEGTRPRPDIVLLDMNFSPGATSGAEGLEWLERLRELFPDAVFVAMSAYGEIDIAVQAVQAGAADFIIKPWENEKLRATVGVAAELSESRFTAGRARGLGEALSGELERRFGEIIGDSDAIREVMTLVRRAGPTDADVLIQGENGTGKELVARALHKCSARAAAPFVPVDMGALSPTLFESELFGHRRGAVTGAEKSRVGRLEAADGGTVFLDEVSNLPMELQPRLLRALESREVVPVGANEAQAFDVRLISASNKDLHAEVGAGRFREDLLYRLNTVVIPIPPLRERGNDALIIAEHVLAGLRKRLGRPSLRLGDSAKRRVLEYPWPGNVRELRHAVERAAILSELDEIGPDALGLGDGRQAAPPTGSDYVPRDAELASGDGGKLPTLNLTELERRAVRTAMEQCHGNVSRAAELLGISRAALYRRLAREGDE